MARNELSDVARMAEIMGETSRRFRQFIDEIDDEIFILRLTGETTKAEMLARARKLAAADHEKMRHALGKALLSSDLIAAVAASLSASRAKADAVLAEMAQLKATLELVAKGAEVIREALGAVLGILR